jgi:hypothetical protein
MLYAQVRRKTQDGLATFNATQEIADNKKHLKAPGLRSYFYGGLS